MGIFAQGGAHRIEGNHLTMNSQYGLSVTGTYNIIIGNTARNPGAVNWNIAANNRAGAFVSVPLNGAINGSSGGAGSGTTDPYANLSF